MSGDPNEPLLSLEETNALLDAMRSGAEDDGVPVESADLASPERTLRDALGRADRCGRQLAHHTSRVFLRMVGCKTVAEEQPAEISPYKVLRSAIARGSAIGILRSPDGSQGLLVVGPTLVSFLLTRRLGAPLNVDGTTVEPPRGELSPLDRRIIGPAVVAMAEAFSEQWCGDPAVLQVERLAVDSSDLPPLPQFEPLLQLGLRVAPTGCPGAQLVIGLPVGTVRDTTRIEEQSKPIVATPEERDAMVEGINQTHIYGVAVLGSAVSTVGEVLRLAAGDIIRLDGIPEQPIELRVEGNPVLKGLPVVQHGNMAIQVTHIC